MQEMQTLAHQPLPTEDVPVKLSSREKFDPGRTTYLQLLREETRLTPDQYSKTKSSGRCSPCVPSVADRVAG